jgi:hypothetical protein
MNLVKNCYHHPHGQKLEFLEHISKEERDHQFMLTKVYTEHFKQSFLYKCRFNDIFEFRYTVYINYNVNAFVNNLIIISYMHCRGGSSQ